MPPRIKTVNPYKKAGELRRSQIITTFGVGALVDLPRLSGIMAGLDSWDLIRLPEESKIHERNLEKMLGKNYFVQASSPETESGNTFGLRAYRFPNWYYCPECHHLDHYKKISGSLSGNSSQYNYNLYCNNDSCKPKKSKLIPSRFIIACLNGHIDDFPYVWWTHKHNIDGSLEICDNPKLDIKYEGVTGGLDSINLYCETCNAHATMSGCMNENSLRGFECKGNSPWLGITDKGWYKDPSPCNAQLRVLQRSANNVYYPVNKSALTIPPWSGKIHALFAQRDSMFENFFEQEDDEETIRRLKSHYNKHSSEYLCDEASFIKEAFKVFKKVDSDIIPNEKTLNIEEYNAFCGKEINEEYFKTETSEVFHEFSPFIKQIKMVKKIREVMVLQGFRRILPAHISDDTERKRLGLSDKDFSSLSKQPLEWLPAIELFGEGMFIQFDEDAIEKWEVYNKDRYKKMANSLDDSWEWGLMFNPDRPRFIFLHTFSHLLIRQLSSQCGYATASIKEKIYSTYLGSNFKMSGIFIYTSATDTDGSLGGLVREGKPDRINNTIKSLLEESTWCSNDPICIESKSQGFRGLNYAACHACTLLPETSCVHFNCLLDRASVVGLPDDKNVSFFKDYLGK
jgi:hypothetical protein